MVRGHSDLDLSKHFGDSRISSEVSYKMDLHVDQDRETLLPVNLDVLKMWAKTSTKRINVQWTIFFTFCPHQNRPYDSSGDPVWITL